ncbi:2-dehydro-3-deoxygalactonokinase [Escherichia coli]|uniref:2-dehydro-3-deoxygalactonokinase n=3 Tax=Escherichia coli TaxID=562 RepID=A0A376Y037_ECOLX|nr:2-dehydro-3-deoxygalactonokinase [Escherichia coli]
MTARYIAIDWGSTNLRAWLYQGDHCLESRQSEAGVTRLNGKSPAAVLAEVTTDWREEKTPVVMAGMVGSNVGWKVAPYLSVPACFSSIGEQLTSVGDNIWIIPGLCVSHDDNHNVMRGEETQLIGARALAPSSLYVMPGTHCKWVQADSQQINDFRTVMTGELHHLLLNHSLIGAGLPPQENSADAFTAGLERGLNTPAILPQLFEVRASACAGNTSPRTGQRISLWFVDWRRGRQYARLCGPSTRHHPCRRNIADRALPASLSGDGLRRDGGGGRHGISGWYKEHRSCSGKLNSR